MRVQTVPATLSAIALLLMASAALAQAPAQPAAGTGFRLEVQGTPQGMDPDDFAQAVLKALPPELKDPAGNFTRHELYEAGADYRMVLVFHGNDALDAGTLCAATAGDSGPQTAPPPFENLASTTRIAAAFCKGPEQLSAATDQMTGELMPEQASFRFLVADVTKQLFPGGFDVLPCGSTTAAGGQP